MIARPFIGEPGNYERTPNRHDFSLEPRRPNYLTLVREAGGDGPRGREDPRHLRRPRHGRRAPHEVERRGDHDDRAAAARHRRRASSSSNLVETDMLWGHRNDPINFHRCLQDFDRRLPDILDALRPGDLLIVTSDHGCDPTTPSTDHSREHAMLLALRRTARTRPGDIHDGEFADVGATVNPWLGGKAAGAAPARPADRRAVRQARTIPSVVRRASTPTSAGLPRGWPPRRVATGPIRRQSRSRRSPSARPERVLEVGCGRASSPSGSRASSAARWSRSTSRSGWSSSRAARGVDARRRRRPGAALRRRAVRLRGRGLDALPRARPRSRAPRARDACFARAAGSSR